jgi:two-component system, NarL family, sensor kinase
MTDETEQVAKISTSIKKLKKLNQRFISDYEESLRVFARELHDEIGQNLIAVKLVIGNTLAELPVEQSEIRRKLTLAINGLDRAIENVRSMPGDLRPSSFEIMGINLTLKNYCYEYSARCHIPVEYIGEDLPSLPDRLAIGLYRFVQEALTNVKKHARATKARVCLESENGLLTLSVKDNGRGFDPANEPEGIGLFGLDERFEFLGGSIEITTKPGQGTCLKARVPIP